MQPKLCAIALLLALSLQVCLGQGEKQPLQEIDYNQLINNIFNLTENPHGQAITPQPNVFQPQPTKTTILHDVKPDSRHDGTASSKYKPCGLDRECVPRFLCDDGSINTNGENLFDIRTDAECAYLDKCCDIPNKKDKPIIDIKPPVVHAGCGFRNANGVGFRITGAVQGEAEFGEFPWMCAILREELVAGEELNIYECGGALVAPNAVITGAHCVLNKKAEDLWVRAGEWDTQLKTEVLPYQDRQVKEIIIHENYNKGALYNDIAILILHSDFDLEENVRPICLPGVNEKFDHARCFVTGWGKDKFGHEGVYQNILKKIELPVLPHDVCENDFRQTRLGKYFQFHESFICAGGEKGKDACKGDGGSPLVCPVPSHPDRYYHAGIVAWGIGCGEENVPGAYGNVAYQRNWLDSKLSAKGVDPKYYTF